MIDAFRLILPAGLAAYFIYQAARRPIFLLGIPFLQVMRVSVFFGDLRPFWVPARLGANGLMLLWLVLAWAWTVHRSRARKRSPGLSENARHARLLPEEFLLLALATLVLGKLVWSGVGPADTQTLLGQFAPWAFLLSGYWLIRGVVMRSSLQDVAAFLFAIAIVTTMGSLLFILHQGLRVPIYNVTEFLVFSFQGQVLSRTFIILPPFLFVALAAGYARRSWDAATIALVGITGVAIVVSYTRSMLLAAAAVTLVVLALRAFWEKRGSALLRRVFTIAAIAAIAVVAIVVAVPTSADYFVSRVVTLRSISTAANEPNFLSRQSSLSDVASQVAERYFFAGAPFGEDDSLTDEVTKWASNTMWVPLVYQTGFIGVALVLGMFVLFGLRGCRLFWRSNETAQFLGAVFIGGIVALFLVSVASWTFLDPSSYAMGFWLFAFIAGAANQGVTRAATAPLRRRQPLELLGEHRQDQEEAIVDSRQSCRRQAQAAQFGP